jgi:hypothetical protein
VRQAEDGSVKFYRVLKRNREQDLAELRQFETREDITTYEAVLREILALFGQAIHTSLERTMGNYLRSTGGIYRNEVREEWELAHVLQLLAHNSAAERLFAIVKVSNLSLPLIKMHGLTPAFCTTGISGVFSFYEVGNTSEFFACRYEWQSRAGWNDRKNMQN